MRTSLGVQQALVEVGLVAIGEQHADRRIDIRPTTAMVEVSRLIDPAMLVEVEATAYLQAAG